MSISEERGSTTLWILALSLLMLMIGGIGLDLWRALADQRALAGMADAAAVAAASGVDVAHYRETGEIRLAEDLATDLGARLIAAQCSSSGVCLGNGQATIRVTGTTAVVELRRPFQLSLLRLVTPPSGLADPLEVRAVARADAVFRS